jgi:chromosome segregation ATPase
MDNTFLCDKCNKVFKQKKSLIYHQNKKIPCDKIIENNKCDYCDKELSIKTKISHHLKNCKVYNEYELKQERKNNNKELKRLNNKIKEIENKFDDKIDELSDKIEEQNDKIEELKKEIEILKNKNNKINKEVKVLKKIIKEEKDKKNTNIYDKIQISKEDRIKYLKSNLNIYELVVDKFIKSYYVNEKKPENHLLYITDMNRNKIKYYDGNEWIDGDKKRVMRQVMRNCIIQILDIDRNDKEELKLVNEMWKNTSDNSIDLLYLRSCFSLVDDEGKIQFKGLYNSILNIINTAIYNGKNMINKSVVEDNNINKKIISIEGDIKQLKKDKTNNKDKIVNLKDNKKKMTKQIKN